MEATSDLLVKRQLVAEKDNEIRKLVAEKGALEEENKSGAKFARQLETLQHELQEK